MLGQTKQGSGVGLRSVSLTHTFNKKIANSTNKSSKLSDNSTSNRLIIVKSTGRFRFT